MKTNKNQVNVIAIFKAELKSSLAGGDNLTQKKAAVIALATVGMLFKDDGAPITLSPQQKERLKMMFYPTVTARMNFIKSELADVDCTLDDATEELLNGLLTPANLEKKVKKAREQAPVIDWSEMVDEEESTSPANQNENTGDENPGENDSEALAPVKSKKPNK